MAKTRRSEATSLTLLLKRVYEPAAAGDGRRILVDRLWPRGLSKSVAKLDYWAKEIAPSTELRKWYEHDSSKWGEFQRRYFEELDQAPDSVARLMEEIGPGRATLLYSSKEQHYNNAVALREYLKTQFC